MAKSKSVKKVDVKKLNKEEIYNIVYEAFVNAGYTVADGGDFSMKGMSLIVREVGENKGDVALSFTAPSGKHTTYDYRNEEEEEEAAE